MGKAKHGKKAVSQAIKTENGPNSTPTCSKGKGWSLMDYGLRWREVKADGNCFFRACADQLEGSSGDHMVYRQNTVSFMRQHREDFQPYMEDGEDFDRYCSRMAQDGTWAGQQEQVALARQYGVMIRVYQANQPAWTIKPDFPDFPKDAPTLHLSYHDGEHYNSVRMASDAGSGPPKPIAVQERAAFAKDWSSFGPAQVELVMQGTGCYDDKEAVQRALQDAKGNPDEAIELLVERMASQSLGQQCEQPSEMSLDGPSSDQIPLATTTEHRHSSVPGTADGAVFEQQSLRLAAKEHFAQLHSPEVRLEAASLAETRCASDTIGMKAAGGSSQHRQSIAEHEDSSGTAQGLSPSCTASLEHQPTGKEKEQKGQAKQEKKTARNRACPCGNGRRYKDCCGPLQASRQRRLMQGFQEADTGERQESCVPQLYV